MDRKQIRTALLGLPGAVGAAVGVAAIWETPRNWIGAQIGALASAMTNPFVTMLVTLIVVAYFGSILWTFTTPQMVPASGADLREVEAARERDERRRKMIDDARKMVADFELQTRWSWRQMLRYTPAYTAVRPHLSAKYLTKLDQTATIQVGMGMHEPLVAGFLNELSRLEREWGLS
jgi:hypothetical protein